MNKSLVAKSSVAGSSKGPPSNDHSNRSTRQSGDTHSAFGRLADADTTKASPRAMDFWLVPINAMFGMDISIFRIDTSADDVCRRKLVTSTLKPYSNPATVDELRNIKNGR